MTTAAILANYLLDYSNVISPNKVISDYCKYCETFLTQIEDFCIKSLCPNLKEISKLVKILILHKTIECLVRDS